MPPKTVKQLADKKYRNETGLFMVEGEKNIKELLQSDFRVQAIFGTSAFLDSIIDDINAHDERMHARIEVRELSQGEIERLGTLVTNEAGIAVAQQTSEPPIQEVQEAAQRSIVLVLDDIRDPGNLGTILRIADWYGVTHIVASPTTTDLYNPKVIGASMGSFARVRVTYFDLGTIFTKDIPVIVASLDGENLHTAILPSHGYLVMGSESHGVSQEIFSHATERITIPRFGKAESLNVAVSTAIILDTLRKG